VTGSYEYRRYETGQVPFWTPLRFPGQYYDAESDLFENWNRYYQPICGTFVEVDPFELNGRWIDLLPESWSA
jgi:RHS repeat-associated protein